ncbi:MFS transporter [Candidatus Woesearchaeota archaeon]|nr:MFS transporter [Candidatus Woesearchaeota archaeon]
MRSDNKSNANNIVNTKITRTNTQTTDKPNKQANEQNKEQNNQSHKANSSEHALNESAIKTQMRNSVLEGNAFAVMAGFTQAYLSPFAIALNAPLEIVAFVTAIPEFLGSIVQLATIRILKTFENRKFLIISLAFLQAFLWLPILLLPYFNFSKSNYILLIAIASFSGICSALLNPLWNSWIGEIVPENTRGRYFSQRTKIIGTTTFAATIIAGLILAHFKTNIFFGFAILFGTAFFARALSALLFTKIIDADYNREEIKQFPFIDFIKNIYKRNYSRFVLKVALIRFATNIATPLYAIYMLRELNFSHIEFMAVIAAPILASYIFLPLWGKINDKFGSKNTMYFSGLALPAGCLFWLFFSSPTALFIVEFVKGAIFAGFNIAVSNFIFDSTTKQKRICCLSYYNFIVGIALFLGALVGIGIANGEYKIFGSTILLAFVISAVVRIITVLVLPLKIDETRLVEVNFTKSFFRRFVTIEPGHGLVYETVSSADRNKDGKNNSHLHEKEITELMHYTKQKPQYLPKENYLYHNKHEQEYFVNKFRQRMIAAAER